MSEPQPPKTHDDLAADAITLGGLLDGAWFLHGEEAREARNAMLPILEAARPGRRAGARHRGPRHRPAHGGAAMTGAVITEPEGYRDAHERTSEALYRVQGLARALYDLTFEHPALGTSDPSSEAIVTLIAVIGEKATQAGEHHGQEWKLIVKPKLPVG